MDDRRAAAGQDKDPIDDGVLREEGDDAHRASAAGLCDKGKMDGIIKRKWTE